MNRFAPILAALALSVACAPGSMARSPEDVTRQYALALKSGDAAAAHALLTQDAQRRIPLPRFERMLREQPGACRAIADSLLTAREAPQTTATVRTADGRDLNLVWEDGAWRATLDSIDLYSQQTPEAAVRAFVRAYQAQRYDVLLRLVPESMVGGLDIEKFKTAMNGGAKEELDARVQLLELSLDTLRIEELGERASVTYGPTGNRLHLLFEDGVWKIEEFDDATYSHRSPQDE